jgi:cellulose synthase/poly-beta-1,6-N-acetylglucosamine synthase-like glycosyltransferase
VNAALEAASLVALSYFVVLNALYVLFTAIAWRGITDHLHERAYGVSAESFASPLTPPISVLLPAFNEEVGIVESVRSLLSLRYPRFEIVVVSDGSTDGTLERLTHAFGLVPVRKALRDGITTAPVRAAFASRRHPELSVIDKENGGKADALNCGVNAALYPYVCAIDADALLEDDALIRVAQPILDDPDRVVATGGIVRIVNGCTVSHGRVTSVGLPTAKLAVMQVVEYFRAFLVGRVGWSRVKSLVIISGAFGLFRRSVVEAVGGWATDTVGEDVELVMRMHRYLRERAEDYEVRFVPDPVCWTEAPEDISQLSRQRRRWQRGLAETLWRHRRLWFNPRYGFLGAVAIPYFLVFELLGPVIQLLGYPVVLFAFATGAISLGFVVAFLSMALLLGIVLSVCALALEEFSFRRHARAREAARLVLYAVLENFGYRQLNDWWRLRAFVDLARGQSEWGEMKRRGFREGEPTERSTSASASPAR